VNFFDNGIVIQSINRETKEYQIQYKFSNLDFITFKSYNGLSRYVSWPLEQEKDSLSIELSKETEKWFNNYSPNSLHFNLKVIPDRSFLIEYLRHCQEKDIDTRSLFCKTNKETPLWNVPIPELKFLGYDYATSEDLRSSIPEDLLDPVTTFLHLNFYKSFVDLKQLLNENKLFSSLDDIYIYIKERNKLMNSDIQWTEVKYEGGIGKAHLIENLGDFTIFHLSEVIGEI
jgi:hypothetical protein